MSTNTPNLSLLKKNAVTDASDTFNIDVVLNDNWDKIDSFATKNDILKVTSKSANATLTLLERGIVAVTTGASTITLTLPTTVGNAQLVYIIKKVDSGAGVVNIATNSGQFIDGSTNRTVAFQYSYIQIVSDGTGWQVVDSSTSTINANLTGDVTSIGNTTTIAPNVIVNADINTAAGIDPTKIADGSVNATEFQYINSLTSNVQTQIDTHLADYTLQIPYGGTTTGPANTYVLAAPTIAALTAGMAISVKFNLDSTGASTLNWNGKGAKGIKKANGTDVTNLKATGIYTLRYDGTNFILQGEGGGGNAVAANLLATKTATVDAGDIVGTMVDRSGATRAASGSSVAGTTLTLTNPDTGYQDTTSKLSITDANLIAANILNGKSILGVAGSLIKGKNFATGTVSTTTNTDATVTGLAFRPAIFVLWKTSFSGTKRITVRVGVDAGLTYYNPSNVLTTYYTIQLNDGGSYTTDPVNYITPGGFTVNMPADNFATYAWFAYE